MLVIEAKSCATCEYVKYHKGENNKLYIKYSFFCPVHGLLVMLKNSSLLMVMHYSLQMMINHISQYQNCAANKTYRSLRKYMDHIPTQ